MRGSLARVFCVSLFLVAGSALAFAQEPTTPPPPQGEATGKPTPLSATPSVADDDGGTPVIIEPVAASALPNVSPESIGVKIQNGLGAEMWKGTNRAVAEKLLASLAPTSSPVLNDLAQRLLMTAATPPEGDASAPQILTSRRAEKLVLFGKIDEALSLVQQADPKLIDAATFKLVAESALADGNDGLCSKAADFVKNYAKADWQEFQIVCRLRAKDNQAAQVALDVLRSDPNHNPVFIDVASRNILSSGKSLPFQLTPATPMVLALLKQANLPVPASLFVKADFANVAALLRLPAQQDVARLALAERAFERGLFDARDIEALYRATSFAPDALASPLATNETGFRLRALLFRALDAPKEPDTKIAFTTKFAQSALPPFVNGAGGVFAAMLGDIAPSPSLVAQAVPMARFYMLAGKTDAAKTWFALAQKSVWADDMQALWPQFALAGLEADAAYAADFTKWFEAALKGADEPTVHNVIVPTMLFFESVGLKVPESAWTKVFALPFAERKISYSPLLYDRLRASASSHRRAETVLESLALAGENEISLPAALTIAWALYQADFKAEAAAFARNAVALLSKDS